MDSSFNADKLEYVIEAIVDRISQFRVPSMWFGITDIKSTTCEYTTVKFPTTLKKDLLTDPESDGNLVYAFQRYFPEELRKIIGAIKGDDILISLEAPLGSTGITLSVLGSLNSHGLINVKLAEKLKVEAYMDANNPRLYMNFHFDEER